MLALRLELGLLVVPPLIVRRLTNSFIMIREFATIVCLDLVESWAVLSLVVFGIAMIAATSPSELALRFES